MSCAPRHANIVNNTKLVYSVLMNISIRMGSAFRLMDASMGKSKGVKNVKEGVKNQGTTSRDIATIDANSLDRTLCRLVLGVVSETGSINVLPIRFT